MALIIRSINFNLIPGHPNLLKQLRKLTLHSYSGMNQELDNLLELIKFRQVKAQVLLAYQDTNLVGWALLSQERSAMVFWRNGGYHFEPTDGMLFEVFVDPSYRRQGIGTELIKVARRKAQPYRLCVAPWSTASQAFYNNFPSYGNKWL